MLGNKILFIVNVDWFFVSHRLPIAVAAIQDGFEVHIACGVTDKKELLESQGLIVHQLTISRSGKSVLCEVKLLAQLFSIIKFVKPDVTHCVTIKPVLYGNIVARLLKVPFRISSISGLGYVFIADGLKSKILKFFISKLYTLALHGSKRIIFQNISDRDTLKFFGAVTKEQELFIRGSGIDLDLYSASEEPSGVPVVMLVSRLLVDKGVNEFASAAKIIKSSYPHIRMVLVGDVDIENPKSLTPCQINEWVSEDILEHWGCCQNMAQTIAKSNLIVLPSYREGLPKCLIEAAACGRAVITTDVPGCRDAIEPNTTGVLVPVKTVQPLVDAILTLINDYELRANYAMNGRKLAEKAFDINDVVRIHLDTYTLCKGVN